MTEINKNTIVVFDANAYRSIAEFNEPLEVMDLIKKKEQALGVSAKMSSTVAMELIRHLKEDERDDVRQQCCIAASIMYSHTGNEGNFNLLPLTELQIAKLCFGEEDEVVVNTQVVIGQILFSIKNNPSNALVKYSKQISSILDFLEKGRTAYDEVLSKYFESVHNFIYSIQDKREVEKRRKVVESQYNGDSFGFDTVLALLFSVQMMLLKHGKCIVLTKKEILNAAQILLDAYKIPLAFRRNVFLKKLEKNANVKNIKFNNQFDEYILFLVDKTCGDKEILLISDDSRMIDAAKSVNVDSRIMHLSDYLNFLKVEYN